MLRSKALHLLALILTLSFSTATSWAQRAPSVGSCAVPTAADLMHSAASTGAATLKPVGYFRLSLSWSPAFCATSAGQSAKNKYQCKENRFGLVVHGLWPQTSGATSGDNQPRNCKAASLIANDTVKQNMCVQPGAQLMQDEWSKHGTCAFNTPEAYLAKEQAAYKALKIPDLNVLADKPGLKASDIVDSFTKANPGLTPPAIQLELSASSLSEVHVCYDMQLKFRKCDTTQSVKPTSPVKIRKIGKIGK